MKKKGKKPMVSEAYYQNNVKAHKKKFGLCLNSVFSTIYLNMCLCYRRFNEMSIIKDNNLQILQPNIFKISTYYHPILHLIMLNKTFVFISVMINNLMKIPK